MWNKGKPHDQSSIRGLRALIHASRWAKCASLCMDLYILAQTCPSYWSHLWGKRGDWHTCRHTHAGTLVGWRAITMVKSPWPLRDNDVWQDVCTEQLPPYLSNTDVFIAVDYLTCVKLSAEEEMLAQMGTVRPQMSNSGNQRSICEDLMLPVIDVVLWETLNGPPTGYWHSEGILCLLVPDCKHTTAFIQLQSRWLSWHFIRSDANSFLSPEIRYFSFIPISTVYSLENNQTAVTEQTNYFNVSFFVVLNTKSYTFVEKHTVFLNSQAEYLHVPVLQK